MSLYPLDMTIEHILVANTDPETGELLEGVTDEDLAQQIQQATADRETLLDSLASEVKNSRAEEMMVKTEKENLAKRQKVAKNRADRAERLLSYLLQNEKWQNNHHKISFRKSEVAVPDDEFIEWAHINAPGLLKATPEVRIADLRQALKNGVYFEHAHLETHYNIQVK